MPAPGERLGADDDANGWIAIASRDGDPWVRRDESGCDSIGPSVAGLAAMSPGEALGCLGAQEVTFDAKIVDCMCDVDGPQIQPAWFGWYQSRVAGAPTTLELLDLDGRRGDRLAPFFAHFTPDAVLPDPLPLGREVQVTGRFDHPSAGECTYGDSEESDPDPVLVCRATFVITGVRVPA